MYLLISVYIIVVDWIALQEKYVQALVFCTTKKILHKQQQRIYLLISKNLILPLTQHTRILLVHTVDKADLP